MTRYEESEMAAGGGRDPQDESLRRASGRTYNHTLVAEMILRLPYPGEAWTEEESDTWADAMKAALRVANSSLRRRAR